MVGCGQVMQTSPLIAADAPKRDFVLVDSSDRISLLSFK